MRRVSKDMLEASQIVPFDPPSYKQNAVILSTDQKPIRIFFFT